MLSRRGRTKERSSCMTSHTVGIRVPPLHPHYWYLHAPTPSLCSSSSCPPDPELIENSLWVPGTHSLPTFIVLELRFTVWVWRAEQTSSKSAPSAPPAPPSLSVCLSVSVSACLPACSRSKANNLWLLLLQRLIILYLVSLIRSGAHSLDDSGYFCCIKISFIANLGAVKSSKGESQVNQEKTQTITETVKKKGLWRGRGRGCRQKAHSASSVNCRQIIWTLSYRNENETWRFRAIDK